MICKNENSRIILETRSHNLFECLSCGLINAVKKEEKNIKPEEIYINYYKKEKVNRFGGLMEFIVKIFRFIRACRIFILKPKAKSILDIGSGRGWMLYFLKNYFGYGRTAGTQISENAYNFSKEKLKLEIYNKDLLELSLGDKFDVITMWHILEHVEKPEEYIQRIYELLDNDGLLFIEVPNFNSWARVLTGKYWLALDLKHHLTFFTYSSLTNLLKKYNFKIKKIRTFSLEYSTFTSTQSIVNLITKSDSYFFEWLQNKNFNLKIIWHIFLFILLFLPCLIINLFLYFSKNGEVLTIIAQKNDRK